MTQSTFSAQVANNLLTLLQGYSKTIRLLLVMFLTLTVTTNAWAQTKTDIMFAKGFGSYTTNSFSAAGTDKTAVANSTNATSVKYAMQVFNGSTGAVRGNQSSAASNFSCRNTTTYDGYYISQVSLTVSGGTIDGSTNNRSVVYFGSTAYSNPNTTTPSGTATKASPASSGQATLTWTNTNEDVSYFILYNLKTSGTALSANATNSLKVVWTKKTAATPSYTVTATSNNNNYGTVSVSGTTITATPKDGYRVKSGDAGYTVTSGTAVVTNNGDNTFSVTPSSNCTITINFEAIPKYTVTWNVNGEVYETTQVTEGSKPTFPATPSSCDVTSNTFYGWTTATWDGKIDNISEKTIYTSANNMPAVNGAITYYAVFATKGAGGGTAFDGTSGGDFKIYALVEGEKKYLKGTGSKISPVGESEATEYTFTKISDGVFSIKTGTTYLTYASSTNLGTNNSAYSWTISKGTKGSWRIASTDTPARGIVYRAASYNQFGGYATNNITADGTEYYDVEIGGGSSVSFSGYITTCAADDPCDALQAPNVTATVTANSITLSWAAVDGATSYNIYNYTTEDLDETTSLTYTFTGLSSETEYEWGVESAKDECFKETRGTTITLAEAPKTYTITFEANGGTKIDKITDATTLPNPLPTTKRDHYTFVGWYMDETFQTQATAGATINANTTLYAKWTPITYTVTFDAGSGSCDTETKQGDFEAGFTLPTATPCDYASTNGWSFEGWSETTVSETTVRPAIHTGNYKPTKNIKLHAVYAKTGAAQGGAGEFILSLQYGGTTYYVGQTFNNSKLSAETNQANAALFTIEDNYLHYEGGYISHVDTTNSPDITKQADKANAQAWTIIEEANTIIFTSTADATRGLGFNYNNGSPRFAAYKLNEKDGETIKYPSTFTKTSVSGGDVQVTTYNSNPSCEAPVDPKWEDATISHAAIQVVCGSKTLLSAADPNGPATISFSGTDLVNSVTVTASDGFFVSTYKTNDASYTSSVTVNPVASGDNKGKITQQVYVIAQAPAQSDDFTGTITLTGADITNGSQVINVTAAVTCTQYTITWSVSGDETQKTTFYAGGEWTLPEDPTFDCNGRVFVGWTNNEIVQPQDIAPNVLYKEQGEFPTIESDITFYAVFAQEGTGDGSGTTTVTDVLNRDLTGVTSTNTYSDWSGKTATSSAVYAGNSCGGNSSIQLRSDKSSAGIITTTSGGKARKVTVVWNTSTTQGRVLNIYGKNSTYSAVTELYGNNAGTLIGNIKYGTSTELIISDDYEYIGIRSNSGAMYLTSISIQWETDGEGDGNATTYTSYTTSCADVKAIRIVEPTTKTFNEGDKFVFDGKVWAINSDDSETDVTNSPLVHFDVDMHKVGEQTVTVSYLTFTATYKITINAVDKWQITWNVSGKTNTGIGPREVVQGKTIGECSSTGDLQIPEVPASCEGKVFMGWTESSSVPEDGVGIEFITKNTVPAGNMTYYAVFAEGSDGGSGNYEKVTASLTDYSGEYLIVYETESLAFNGKLTTLDAATNTISVTISNDAIVNNDNTNAAKFTIAKATDGYTIKSASGYYIGQTSDANGLNASTSTAHTNTISIADGNANIISSGGAYLRYNATSGQERFRYYKSTSYTGQKPIALYKKSDSSASYTDYTTGCHDVTITYYGFKGGYTDLCDGSDLNVITQRVNSSHTIPTCTEITDPTDLGRTFLNLWKDQNGKEHKPGDSFIVTQDITLYAQWALNTSGNTTLPTDVEDLATTDVVVTGGTTLTLKAGTTTINSLTLKGGLQENGTYAMPIVNIPTGATLVRNNNKINLDLKVNNNSYYPFAVPFEVANTAANVNYINTTLKEYANANNGYGKYYRILEYNGALRAEKGVNSDENWVHVGRTDVKLMPGKGYAISAVPAAGDDTVTIRITMNVDNAWLANGEQESITVKEQTTTRNQVTVTAHTGTAADKDICNAGWNFVANPYLTNFTTNNYITGVEYIGGEIIVSNGQFVKDGTEVPYVTIPNANMSWYEQRRVEDAILSPMYSFFVQIAEGGTMTFTTDGRQQAPAALRASTEQANPSFEADIVILNNQEQVADHTGLVINDRWTPAYEIGGDLEKMFGNANKTAIYTLSGNTRLAYNALSYNDALVAIPIGFRAQADGEYTIQLRNTEDIVGVESIELKDLYNNQTTNLLYTDYTFYSDATQEDSRFVVYLVPQKNTPTDISTIINGNTENGKIIFNNHLYIIHNGNIYNGAGQMVK